MEVRPDPRLLALGAALTAGTGPDGEETELILQTRNWLQPLSSHPSVHWLREQKEKAWFLGLAMQTVQLGSPPRFTPNPPDEVPPFVSEQFGDPPAPELAGHLGAIWREGGLAELFEEQAGLWEQEAAALRTALQGGEVEAFQQLFFGRFPYRAVAVPLANLAGDGGQGVGPANRRETYAVCLPRGLERFRSDRAGLLVLVQHEASHPVLDDVQRLFPQVPGRCAFVEEISPPGGRFARAYGDAGFRWVETLIRASSVLYLEFLGLEEEAGAFLRQQQEAGVGGITLFVQALRPWWNERKSGRAPGIDSVLEELPGWLRSSARGRRSR